MANKKYYNKEYEEALQLYNKSLCHIKLKEFDEAIAHLKEAIKHKEDAKYFFNLAYCFYRIKDYKKALIYFNYSWCLDNSDVTCGEAINLILEKVKKVM